MQVLMTAGKGGTGKTMILYHLFKRHLSKELPGRVLVVDADPHRSLAWRLAPDLPAPLDNLPDLGKLRHAHNLALKRGVGLEALSRREFARTLAQQALIRLNERTDLLIMGRNDEHGCQCVVNNILGSTLDALAADYDWVILDNEAGIEPIGRHQWPVDVLLLVASPKMSELDVARKIVQQATDTGRTIRNVWTILNRYRNQTMPQTALPAPVLATLPVSDALDTSETPDARWLRALDALWITLKTETFQEMLV